MLAVVIPSYRVKKHILGVLQAMGPEVKTIYVVDDCCPEGSGRYVQENCQDPRVRVLFHEKNQGVGGAVITGYRQALKDGVQIVVKVDGDGQMDPALIPRIVRPLVEGQADYSKGNRFYNPRFLAEMPRLRLFGNSGLSFITKLSSGYWNIVDPTNGFTAIHARALEILDMDRLSRRYFFESDMLFRLNIVRAVVRDVSMKAKYGDEVSNLKISRVLFEFSYEHFTRFIRRVIYNYFLRDFNVGSIQLLLGLALTTFGAVFGISKWIQGSIHGAPATSGSVMLAALPIIIGTQFLLGAIQYDVSTVPSIPLQKQ